MTPVFLLGFMGSGKTTLGRTVSRKLGIAFYDLDIFIENRFHKTVKEIFAERGEEEFRNIERNAIEELCEFENVIIACGGGTPCYFNNMELMNGKGKTVWLDASPESIYVRLTIPSAKAKRPLVANMSDGELREFINNSLESRKKYYSKASIRFDASYLESKKQIEDSTNALANIIMAEMKV